MNRKQWIILLAALLASSGAFAGSRAREMSPTPAPVAAEAGAQDKVQIKGNTSINARSQNNQAIAVGEGNSARNTTGAIRAGSQIQGNTRINAASSNASAIAVGRGNSTANQAGVIGGN